MAKNEHDATPIDRSLIQNNVEAYIEQFARFIHTPSIALQPYRHELIARQYNKGQVIYYASEELTHVYYLIEGYVLREHYNAQGDMARLFNKKGQLFPIHHLFQDKTANEMCTALTKCIVLAFPIELLEYLCRNEQKVFVQIFKHLCDIKHRQIEYSMALNSKSAKERIIKTLRYLCHTIGEDHDEFYEISDFLTIQMLSDLVSISRETTGHIINELKEQNIIMKNHKKWMICKTLQEVDATD